MAFITSVDNWNPLVLGDEGSVVLGAERDVYYAPYATLSVYNPVGDSTTFIKIDNLEEFTATEDENLIEVWNGRLLEEKKTGRTNSTLTIKQALKSTLNSIHILKNQDLWFAECLSDDRASKDNNGLPIYYEIRLMRGKLSGMKEDKGDAEALYYVTGEGSFEVASKKILQKGITPCGGVTLTPTDGTSATSGVAKTFIVTASDLYSSAIDLTDLLSPNLMNEISAINIVKVSGTPTMTVVDGVDDATKEVTFTGTGSCVVKAQIITKNAGIWESSTVSITVS